MVKARINLILKGEPARWLLEWKKRGLVSNCRDAIIQAFKVYHEKILDQDLRAAQLRTLVEDG